LISRRHHHIHLLRLVLLFALILLTAHAALGQGTATVSGVVRNESGTTIPQALVFVEAEAISVLTDLDGKYSVVVPAGRELILEARFSSNTPFLRAITLEEGEVRTINIRLKSKEFQAVEVFDKGKRNDGMEPIPVKLYSRIPTVTQGIEGILLGQLGLRSNNELSSSYSVRGGSFDENLVYVNDIEVYRPFLARSGQQEGLSFPNPDMVSKIEFSAGGFDARYGDKMSSVLDITYGRPQEFEGAVLASMLGGSAYIGGPVANGRLTQITGARYKANQTILRGLDSQGDYRPRFFDLQSYWTYALSDQWELGFLGNLANNRYNFVPSTRRTQFGSINEALQLTIFFEGQEIVAYDTRFGALNLNYKTKDMVLKLVASSFNTYETEDFDILGEYRLDELERDLGSDEFGEVARNIGVGGYLNHARNTIDATVSSVYHRGYLERGEHSIQWGTKLQHEEINDRLNEWNLVDSSGYSLPFTGSEPIELDDLITSQNNISSNRISGYVQDNMTWEYADTSSLNLTYGIRANHWSFNKETVISPRARIAYDPNWKGDMVFRFATGLYYQPPFYRELRGIDGTLNEDIKAQRSIHFVAGTDRTIQLFGRDFKWISEAYYKKYDNLIPYEIENVRLRYYAENNAKGFAYGVDTKLNGEFLPGVESWASLSFLNAKEDIIDDFFITNFNSDGEEIEAGVTFNDSIVRSVRTEPGLIPRPTDQRINFSMFFQDEMPRNPSYKVQLRLNYGSGLPFGPPSFERYRDVERSPRYRRVDIGFTKQFIDKDTEFEKRPNGFWSNFNEVWMAVEVFNLLQVPNVQSYLWIKDVRGRLYGVPNFLTPRTLNLKFQFRF